MARCSARRIVTTLLVVLSLFSQLALASYRCPSGPSPASAPMAMEMAPGEPCQGMATAVEMDEQQPVLCHQHCINAPQTFDPLKVPALSLPAVVHVLVVPMVLGDTGSELALSGDAGQARPPPQPLLLSTLRLRV
jgi:hypothetical protein